MALTENAAQARCVHCLAASTTQVSELLHVHVSMAGGGEGEGEYGPNGQLPPGVGLGFAQTFQNLRDAIVRGGKGTGLLAGVAKHQ